MNTRFKLSLAYKLILFVCIFIFSSISTMALENSLSGVSVQQNSDGSYNILLKMDKSVKMKKNIDSETDKMVIMLDSTLPSEALEIIYDNASGLNNVIVQKKNDKNTLILFEGNNIENSKIFTKELSTGNKKQANFDNNSFNNFLFIADKKLLASVLSGFGILFLFMIALRPKEKRYYSTNNYNKVKTYSQANTLRNKNLVQSRCVPSINYNINSGFAAHNPYITKPDGLLIKNHNYIENEQIRKAG